MSCTCTPVHAVRPSGEQRASRVAFGASRAIMEHSPPRPAAMGLYFSDAVWAPASPPLDTDSASDESLDIVDLSWSPEPSMIAPTTPWCNDPSGSKRVLGGEHSNTLEVAGNLAECNGHDFGKETRPRGEPEDRIRRDILQEWIEPLNNEFASAQDLLDAFSTTPPSISRAASPEPDHPPRQNAGRLSQADAVCKAPSLIGDHGGTVHKFEPVWPFTCTVIFETPDALSRDASRATEDVRYSPKQCTAEVSSLNQPTHTSRRASFWGSSFGGVRSVTDDAFSKLAHDLASKLAQRRAWESRGSERKGGACDEVSAQSAGAPVIDPAPPVEDNSGLVSRMKVLREQASNSIFPAGPASAKTHCDGIQKCDDAAKRRVSSETKRIFLSGSEQTLLHAKGIADGPDSLAGAERRPDGSQKSDPAKRNACENQTPSSVTVRILEAKMLAARKFGGLPDPCCWISLHRRSKMSNCSRRGQGCQSEVTVMDMKAQHAMRPQFKSAVVKQARDPVWNSSISLSVAYQCTSVILDGIEHESATSGALSGQAVNLFLTVHDHGARHSFLGQAAITDISPGAVVDRWVTLQRRDGSRQMDSRGRVSSVRVKIDYACNQATSDVKSRIWGPSHHLETDGPCDQDCLRKAHDRISKSPYQFRASVEQRTSVETLQSVVRRVLSTRVFRLTLLQSRFLKTELEGHKAGSRKLEVADVYKLDRSKSENTSTSFEIAAEIITGASDYDVTAFANDVSVRQTDTERKERHEMTDYALRNRSSLGQDLGMGLQDENGSQEQARKYLDESWGVLQSILPADLQNERACWVMQRLAKCGQFQDRPDVAALSGMSARSRTACNESRWSSPFPHLPLGKAEGLREKSIQKTKQQSESGPEPLAGELEKMYKTACKESASRPVTYRQLREMSIGEAAKVVRRRMSLSPTCNREKSQRSPSSSSPSTLSDVCRPSEIIDLEESDDDSLLENAKIDSGPSSTLGGIQVGQAALSKLIHSCDEFQKATQRKPADKDCRIDVANPKSMRTPSPSNGSKGSKGLVAPFNRDRSTGNGSAQFVQPSITPSSAPLSRLVILEAQLRALDAL